MLDTAAHYNERMLRTKFLHTSRYAACAVTCYLEATMNHCRTICPNTPPNIRLCDLGNKLMIFSFFHLLNFCSLAMPDTSTAPLWLLETSRGHNEDCLSLLCSKAIAITQYTCSADDGLNGLGRNVGHTSNRTRPHAHNHPHPSGRATPRRHAACQSSAQIGHTSGR